MSGSGGRKPPLVAERRAAKSKPRAKPKPSKKGATRAKRRKTKARSNPVIAFFQRIINWLLRLIWVITSRVALTGALVILLAVLFFYATLPPYSQLLDARVRGSVTLLDRDGAVFAWRGEQFGGQIDAQTVAPALKNAVVATEDKRFYWHPGIDPKGIASAIRINLREGRGPLSGHGGSTITQQTAKLMCLGGEL